MRLIVRNSIIVLQTISYLQIIGGITGLVLIWNLLLQTGAVNGPLLLIFLTGIGLFLFSIYCGKVLIGSNKRKGIIYSLVNQGLQLFQWSAFGYGISYSSGARACFGIKELSLTFDFAIVVSSFDMYLNSGEQLYVKVNMVAVFVMIVLYHILKDSAVIKSQCRKVPCPEIGLHNSPC